MPTGWIGVETVYEFPSFVDDFAGVVVVEGAAGLVAESVEVDFEVLSLDGVAAGELSVPELSEPEDSVEELSVDAALAGPPERLSVL
jgi:hypothetical protein